MIVVHPSTVLMLLLNLPGANAVAAKLCAGPDPMMSPVAVMDVLLTLSQEYADPGPILSAFLRQSHIGQRPVDSAQASFARQGFLTFGAGRWGLADSFTYGLAKVLDAPVLSATEIFSGSDLTRL